MNRDSSFKEYLDLLGHLRTRTRLRWPRLVSFADICFLVTPRNVAFILTRTDLVSHSSCKIYYH